MVWLVIAGIAGVLVGVLVLLLLVMMAIGARLPLAHTATRRVRLPVDRQRVWDTLTDVAEYPSWRPRVTRVEMLGTEPTRWRELGKDGKITFAVEAADPPRRLVTRITDEKLPFGGSWTYDLEPDGPDGAGCVVTVTEHGEVRNLAFRFMSRYVFGHAATIDGFLTALGTRFGHTAAPESVPT
ncbi:MAG: SRPBCC family protein [Actinophytocola sp.]|uniref:SRPBCC family protein n=1 Tax=Actinophytocola sp. TaxID=1872138 RepID=UPI003D6AF360